MNNQSYPHPAARAYCVKLIKFTFPNVYHIVNVETKITHSSYTSLEQARQIMNDMNLVIKRERTMVIARAKRLAKTKLTVVA